MSHDPDALIHVVFHHMGRRASIDMTRHTQRKQSPQIDTINPNKPNPTSPFRPMNFSKASIPISVSVANWTTKAKSQKRCEAGTADRAVAGTLAADQLADVRAAC